MAVHRQGRVDHHLARVADADAPQVARPGVDAIGLDVDRCALGLCCEEILDLCCTPRNEVPGVLPGIAASADAHGLLHVSVEDPSHDPPLVAEHERSVRRRHRRRPVREHGRRATDLHDALLEPYGLHRGAAHHDHVLQALHLAFEPRAAEVDGGGEPLLLALLQVGFQHAGGLTTEAVHERNFACVDTCVLESRANLATGGTNKHSALSHFVGTRRLGDDSERGTGRSRRWYWPSV